MLFDRENYLTLCTSLIGVTSLIFSAKGNPAGQLLMVCFSLLYGIISYRLSYYGEMISYLGMTMPMSVLSLAGWLRHPYKNKRSEVRVGSIGKTEAVLMLLLTLPVVLLFFFLLKLFHTAYIFPATVSIATSFIAVYLSLRRSPLFALAYAANDIVLIILWVLASLWDSRYICVVVCFATFLVNDLYGYISWRRMRIRQKEAGEVLSEGQV